MPLPEPDSGRSTGSSSSGGSTGKSAGGWDDSIADRFTFDASAAISMDARRSCSVSSHAVAHGCSVLGIRTPDSADGDDAAASSAGGRSSSAGSSGSTDTDNEEREDWVAWEATFEPNRVCRVASNADGTVIVASTAAGTVSLMSGRDGGVLATRRVYSATGEGESIELLHQMNFFLIPWFVWDSHQNLLTSYMYNTPTLFIYCICTINKFTSPTQKMTTFHPSQLKFALYRVPNVTNQSLGTSLQFWYLLERPMPMSFKVPHRQRWMNSATLSKVPAAQQ